MSLNDFYRKIEDSYYKAMDFLNDKIKIPVYNWFVNPVETRGIPSFPVALLLLLLVLCGVFVAFFGIPGLAGEGGESKLSVFVQSAGAPLDGAKIVVVADGSEVANAISKNGKASFTGLPNADLIIRATLDGYNEAKAKISWPNEKSVRLELKCASAECAAQGGGEATATPPSTEWTLEGEAKLVVTLSDAATSKLADGQIRVYNAKTNTLLKSQKTVAGQAIFEIDAGTSVYANAEADGYLAYDGSAKQIRLKQGRNDLSVKLTPTKQSGCKDGASASCTTLDGYAGTKACAGGAYGACVATPLGCTRGPSVSCTTFDNCAGAMSCNSTKFYGACIKSVASCSSHCTPGATIPCTTPDGYNGTMLCNSSGFYGACVRVPQRCTAGATLPCTTSDACAGTLSCNATGFYGDCVKTQAPLSQCQGVANYATSVFRVSYSNGSGMPAAKIDVYNASNTAAPLVRDKLTNANGSLSLNLSNAAGAAYFAVASKNGFFEEASGNFSAGDSVSITLSEIGPNSTSRLNASAFDDERAPVNEAVFVLFATNARGQTYRVAEKTAASGKNFVVFDGLRRGANVTINASKGAADGSAQALLASENNSANVTLIPSFALLRFQAIDLSTGDPISSAVFQVTRLGATAGSCSGVNCTIRIYSGRFYNATAAAAGYEPNPFVFPQLKALPEQELNLTAAFLSADSVEQTAATLVGIYEKESGLQATHLISGQEYTARFQLTAKPNAELDGTGLHVSFGENGLAYFTGYGPRAAVEQAAQSSEDNGCAGIEGTDNGLSFANKKYEWLDLEYDGARSIAVDVDFKISSNARLDPRTHQGTLTLRYRSFGRASAGDAGSATRFFRNPFDEALGVAVDSPLESGCNAQANEFALPLSATTCDDNVCLWLSYSQGNSEGGDGFKAQSMKRVNPASSDYKPLVVHYAIDFLKAPTQTQGFALAFSAPPANLEFTNYSDPLNDSSDCGSMAAFNPAAPGTGSWTLDLSRVAQCSNYGRFPMRLEGVAYAAPQDTANKVDVQLVLGNGQTPLLTKQSWLNITNGTATPPTGDSATLSLKLNQTQNGRSVQEQSDSNDVFSAGSVTVDAQLRLSPPQQNYSYVYASYSATARYDVYNARIEVSVPSYASSPLRFLGVLPDTGGFIAANAQGIAEVSGGDLRRGRAISGRALFAPVLASGAESAYGQIVLRFKANDWAGAALTLVERAPKQVFVSSAIAPPNLRKVNWFAPGEDNCGGKIEISVSSGGEITIENGCTDLGMQISTVLPADAVPTKITRSGSTRILAKVVSGDGRCIEDSLDALISPGEHLLKYDATKCSPQLPLVGDNALGQNLTVKLYVSGAGEPNCGDARTACFDIHVKAASMQTLFLRKALSVYPIRIGAKNPPDIWTLTNNRQYPSPRALTISLASSDSREVSLAPGETRVFAVKKGTNFAVKEGSNTLINSASIGFEPGEVRTIQDSCAACGLMGGGCQNYLTSCLSGCSDAFNGFDCNAFCQDSSGNEKTYSDCIKQEGSGENANYSGACYDFIQSSPSSLIDCTQDCNAYEGSGNCSDYCVFFKNKAKERCDYNCGEYKKVCDALGPQQQEACRSVYNCDALPTGTAPTQSIDVLFSEAKKYAYWRGSKQTSVCQVAQQGSGYAGPCTEEGIKENSDECCKTSIDDWRNMVTRRVLKSVSPCTSCVAFPAAQYNCDSHCYDVGGGMGIAQVGKGERMFNGTAELVCALDGGCSFACTSFCSAPVCDDSPDCVNNVKRIFEDVLVQDETRPWLNDAGTQLQNFEFEPVGIEGGKKPLTAFSSAEVKVASVENKIGVSPDTWLNSLTPSGCSDGNEEIDYRGVYAFSREDADSTAASATKASVLRLQNSPDSFFGYPLNGGTEKACSKASADGVFENMSSVPLCSYLWVDESKAYGTCVSSVYSFEQPTKKSEVSNPSRVTYALSSLARLKFYPSGCTSEGGDVCPPEQTIGNKRQNHLYVLQNDTLVYFASKSRPPGAFILAPLGAIFTASIDAQTEWGFNFYDPLGRHCYLQQGAQGGFAQRHYGQTIQVGRESYSMEYHLQAGTWGGCLTTIVASTVIIGGIATAIIFTGGGAAAAIFPAISENFPVFAAVVAVRPSTSLSFINLGCQARGTLSEVKWYDGESYPSVHGYACTPEAS